MAEENTVIDYTPTFQEIFLTPKYLAGTALLLLTTVVGAVIPVAVAFIRSQKIRVRLTNERLIVESGLLSTSYEEIELFRIKDSSFNKSFLSPRGEVVIRSVDASVPVIKLKMSEARSFRETLRKLVNEQKDKKGVQYRERVS